MKVRSAPLHLRGSVDAVWELRGRLSGRCAGLPKPYAEFIISLSGTHEWRASEHDAPLTYTDGWLTPVQAAPRFAETIGELHLVGARLHPAATARLFGPTHAGEPSTPIPLDALLGAQTARLREALLEAGESAGRFRILCQWLSARLLDPGGDWLPSLDELRQSGWRVDALADQVGLSSRGLRKRFVRELGIGPKLWLQLGRFDAVLRHRPKRGSLADLAARFGYTDQAHMNAEFRRFAGITPGAYLDARIGPSAPADAPHLLPGLEKCRNLQSAGRMTA